MSRVTLLPRMTFGISVAILARADSIFLVIAGLCCLYVASVALSDERP
jgi:hypothetical protein